MKIFSTAIPKLMVALALLVFGLAIVSAPVAYAAIADTPADCKTSDGKPGVKTSIAFGGSQCIAVGGGDLQSNIIIVVLKIILAFLAGGVGIAVVGGIVWGGLMYMTARGDAGQVKKAEEVIRNAVIGLLAFLGMAAILNFLIPGGVLG